MFTVHFIICRTLTSKDMDHCIVFMVLFLCTLISLDQTLEGPVSDRKNCSCGKVITNNDFEKLKKEKFIVAAA